MRDDEEGDKREVNDGHEHEPSVSRGSGTGFVLPEKRYLRQAANQVLDAAERAPVPVDPDLAGYMGAFEDDALDEEDALMSLFDGRAPAGEVEDDENKDGAFSAVPLDAGSRRTGAFGHGSEED